MTEEYKQLVAEKERLQEQAQILLLPKDPNDDKNVIIEIRGGAGGEEAALFSYVLYRMYSMYADSKRWKVEMLSVNDTELGGLLLLSYPSLEAYLLSALVHKEDRVPFEQGEKMKEYLTRNKLYQENIKEPNVLQAADDMLAELYSLSGIEFEIGMLDDFGEYNLSIFKSEEHEFETNKAYSILSCLSCALIDLGIIVMDEFDKLGNGILGNPFAPIQEKNIPNLGDKDAGTYTPSESEEQGTLSPTEPPKPTFGEDEKVEQI